MTTSSPVTGKISAAKTALILMFLFVVWVVFVTLPTPKETVKRVPLVESPLAGKLQAVGLPYNLDLAALPEIFTIWADKAEWKDGRTNFAYWHPVMKTYSYYFEATRGDTGIRFRAIPEPHDLNRILDEDDSLPDDCPIRFYRFVKPAWGAGNMNIVQYPVLEDGTPPKPQVDMTPIKVSSPSFEPVPINAQPKR